MMIRSALPDIMLYEKKCQNYRTPEGIKDPHAGYLHEVRTHHKGIPLVVAEYETSSACGMAHCGALGRNQEMHKEEAQGRINADLLDDIHGEGLDGGEIESAKLYQYGSYRARIKVADASSSITGFFLYSLPDFENELNVEIYNDHSRRVLFTTYSGGEQTHTITKELPFDPTTGFHDYRFDLAPDRAEFYADGERLQTFRDGLPTGPMKLFINSWFPAWLPGEKPEEDRYTYVDWVRH